MVSKGDIVKKEPPIARLVNSGCTTEPHLHIRAISGTDTNQIVQGGNGILIYFDGNFPTRNDRIKSSNEC
jgi:murein DD-endopeptidase MepM/ murein hydrolase activator NlpD